MEDCGTELFDVFNVFMVESSNFVLRISDGYLYVLLKSDSILFQGLL